MSLLLVDCMRAIQDILVPPDGIDTDATSTTIANNVASATDAFALSVSGAGEALGVWSMTASGSAATKFVLSGTSGAAVTVRTSGTMTSSNNGATTIIAKWTGQGGSPVRTITLTANVVTPGTLAFNPSHLGWWDLNYGGGNTLRTNNNGVKRPWDGCAVYVGGWTMSMAANAPVWENNQDPAWLWGSKGWHNDILDATDNDPSRGFILQTAIRWLAPRTVPNSSYPPMTAAWPSTKAAFQAITRTNYTINSWWPVGTIAGESQADTLERTRDLWDKLGRGWFDDYLLAPWAGTNGIVKKITNLNPSFVKVILRPCWEGNTIYAPRNVEYKGTKSIQGSSIDSGCYGWVQNDSDAALVKAAMLNYITVLKGISSAAADMFQMALTPLRSDFYPASTPYMKKIHTVLAGESQVFDYLGLDAYDRGMNTGPGYNTKTWQERWNTFAGAPLGVTYWQDFCTGAPATLKYNFIWGEWNVSSGSHWDSKSVVAPRPTTYVQNGKTVQTYCGSDNPTHVKNMLSTLQSAANARLTPNAAPSVMHFLASDAEYDMNVDMSTPGTPVYTGKTNKPAASKMFHHIIGLSWNPTTKTGADFTGLPTIDPN